MQYIIINNIVLAIFLLNSLQTRQQILEAHVGSRDQGIDILVQFSGIFKMSKQYNALNYCSSEMEHSMAEVSTTAAKQSNETRHSTLQIMASSQL